MKYMIMLCGSQQDYDMLTGAAGDRSWSAEDVAALHAFMGSWNETLVESGEFVDGQGLSAPAHARRIHLRDGVPVATDGPYPETQEVLAGYTIVDCASFDRATEIAAQLANTPHPETATLSHEWYVDIRPIEGAPPGPDVDPPAGSVG
ncbi:MAG: YciI family protein [Nocardioidaceae bacterium]